MPRNKKNKSANPGAAVKRAIEKKQQSKPMTPPRRRGRSRERRSPSYDSCDSRDSREELDVEAVFEVIQSADSWRDILFSTTLFEMGLFGDHMDWLREVWAVIQEERSHPPDEGEEASNKPTE